MRLFFLSIMTMKQLLSYCTMFLLTNTFCNLTWPRIWRIQLHCCWVLYQCCAIWTCMIRLIGSRMLSSRQLQRGSIELLILVVLQLQLISQRLFAIIFEDFFLHRIWVLVQDFLSQMFFSFLKVLCLRGGIRPITLITIEKYVLLYCSARG